MVLGATAGPAVMNMMGSGGRDCHMGQALWHGAQVTDTWDTGRCVERVDCMQVGHACCRIVWCLSLPAGVCALTGQGWEGGADVAVLLDLANRLSGCVHLRATEWLTSWMSHSGPCMELLDALHWITPATLQFCMHGSTNFLMPVINHPHLHC